MFDKLKVEIKNQQDIYNLLHLTTLYVLWFDIIFND